MALSGPEIRANLRDFAGRWAGFDGTEKAEAQSLLNELFACYGVDRREAGARFEDFTSLVGFMDLHWPGVCIIEMKRPGTDPTTARDQIQRCWVASADEEARRRAARYVVICSFDQFEIWQPREFPANPRAAVTLDELPERHDVLNFLAGPDVEPSFVVHDREMTKEAARCLARMYESLVDRVAAPPQEIQRDDGAYAELAELHRQLDRAVADCYGWPASVAQDDDELVARLTERNRQISEGEREYQPFG